MESNKLTTTPATKFNKGVINYLLIEDIHQKPSCVCSNRWNHCRRLNGRHGLAELDADVSASRSNHWEAEPQDREAGDHQITAPALKLGLADGELRRHERCNCAERNGNDAENHQHGRLRLRSLSLCYPTGR